MGAVHLPETMTAEATESTENTEKDSVVPDSAALLILRRRLMGRMVRPPRGFAPPR